MKTQSTCANYKPIHGARNQKKVDKCNNYKGLRKQQDCNDCPNFKKLHGV